jgi:hypothetical protein
MNKLAIPALVSACIFFLAFNALGDTACVMLDYNADGVVDQCYSAEIDAGNTTAFDLLNDTCDSIGFDWYNWGAFISEINGYTAYWDPDEEWWMFTVHNETITCPTMKDVAVNNYIVQDGDIIGMWLVSGFYEEWPDTYTCPPCCPQPCPSAPCPCCQTG